MNIFILDKDPQKAAEYHCDKHVIKMILESTQILSTVMNLHGLNGPYRSTHINHSCVKWASETHMNFMWVKNLLYHLCVEYKHRYNKYHKCQSLYQSLRCPTEIMKDDRYTPHVQCMPEQYRISLDPVQAYRNYYMGEKRSFATWKTVIPDWWI